MPLPGTVRRCLALPLRCPELVLLRQGSRPALCMQKNKAALQTPRASLRWCCGKGRGRGKTCSYKWASQQGGHCAEARRMGRAHFAAHAAADAHPATPAAPLALQTTTTSPPCCAPLPPPPCLFISTTSAAPLHHNHVNPQRCITCYHCLLPVAAAMPAQLLVEGTLTAGMAQKRCQRAPLFLPCC
jgi:hypothetical protein